jgi:hypothetical protein
MLIDLQPVATGHGDIRPKCRDNRSDSHDASCGAVFMPTTSEIGIYKAKLHRLPSYML